MAGRLPNWVVLAILMPAAYVSFVFGTLLSLAGLPKGFDYGACVISRLCSSFHNPNGYWFLSVGLIGLAVLLGPVPAWLTGSFGGCPRLGAWGRWACWIGLLGTALIGIERGFCPTHNSRFELLHLVFAGIAFFGQWLGMAMIAGTCGSPDVPRVRWRWLWRPPWFLAATILPLVIIVAMYLPFNVLPTSRAHILDNWPRRLVFLRTPTFWQWYLVAGLNLSIIALVCRAYRYQKGAQADPGPWRLDAARPAAADPVGLNGIVRVALAQPASVGKSMGMRANDRMAE